MTRLPTLNPAKTSKLSWLSDMDVIIFSGQSNMQGQSETLSEHDIVKDAYEYKWLTDELVPLQNPVGENITYSMDQG